MKHVKLPENIDAALKTLLACGARKDRRDAAEARLRLEIAAEVGQAEAAAAVVAEASERPSVPNFYMTDALRVLEELGRFERDAERTLALLVGGEDSIVCAVSEVAKLRVRLRSARRTIEREQAAKMVGARVPSSGRKAENQLDTVVSFAQAKAARVSGGKR